MKRVTAVILSLLLALSVTLTACGNTNAGTKNETPVQTAESGGKTGNTGSETDNGTPADTASSADKSSYEFSGRDLDPAYDEVTAAVTLSDGGSTADGNGVTVEVGSVTITAAGT